jgi:hypothetical protein
VVMAAVKAIFFRIRQEDPQQVEVIAR